MVKISRYISSLIENGRRRIKVLVSGNNDTQTTYESLPFGVDGVPPEAWRAIYADTGEKGRNVIIGYINQNQLSTLNTGDNRIYSTNESGSSVAAFITFLNDGRLQMLGTGDFLVRYNELETGFNQLRTDLNALITAYNAHIHITTATVGPSAVPGILSPTATQGTSSSASITAAKIDEIETIS